MTEIYIAFVDTPGIFASIIRRVIKQKYIHVAIGLDENLDEAYSIGRRHPSIPLIAGFEKEEKRKILRAFPGADYMICSIPCTQEQKQFIKEELHEAMKNRYRYHYTILGLIVLVTFLQRCSVFLLTYMVYLGFGLHGTGMMKVILLQAAVYIAVDMLPLPGAQGITELMYQTVFAHVFTGTYLIPSMLVSRGINFYFLLIVSLIIVLVNKIRYKSTVCRNVKIENE